MSSWSQIYVLELHSRWNAIANPQASIVFDSSQGLLGGGGRNECALASPTSVSKSLNKCVWIWSSGLVGDGIKDKHKDIYCCASQE